MIIRIQAKTNSHRNEVVAQSDGSYLVRTTAKPIDGQANLAIVKLLSDYFHVAKSAITIKSGATAHHKTIEIHK